jgi:hypothetical protein
LVTIKEKFVFFKEIKMQLTYSAIVSLRINPRGFSEGNSEVGKKATTTFKLKGILQKKY